MSAEFYCLSFIVADKLRRQGWNSFQIAVVLAPLADENNQ